jgi:ferrous iron transport protein B
MQHLTIALVGQPNVGKSMLINSISDSHLRVGNFSGVTVEKAEVKFEYEGLKIRIIDLPGAYSLNEYTIEERVTKQFLEHEAYDLILNVVDATNLERNLLLTTELLEYDRKMVIALNMMDEAEKEGLQIDSEQMHEIIGAPCIEVSAVQKRGIANLINACVDVAKAKKKSSKMAYSDAVEEEIEKIASFLEEKGFICSFNYNYRDIALRLIQEDEAVYNAMREKPIWIELLPMVRAALSHLYIHYDTKNIRDIFLEEHNAFVKGLLKETVTFKKPMAQNLTEQIDNILIHKYFGIPIFLFFMWGLFQLTFTLGAIPVDLIDKVFVAFAEKTKAILGEGGLGSLIADGMIGGVGAVVMFLPNIMILFLGIALLETTGYMSRVAFLLDGFFHKFGLHGKSFIPLVTGFGCSVPAYMAARTLKNEKDKLITLFIIGFMSCSARLPIYILFIGAFFDTANAGNILFAIYLTGAIFGLLMAKILRMFVFKGEDEPFVMEMPKYRLPSLRLIWHTVMSNAWMYLKKAGTYILAAAVLIWFMSNYPKQPEIEASYMAQIEMANSQVEKEKLAVTLEREKLENSYLSIVGKATEPFFAPLGFDWRMAVALEAGLAAKEVVVSTLGVLYSLGSEVTEEDKSLVAAIRQQIPLAAAISFIVFVMIYLPCLAASMVFAKEAGGWKYLGYLFVFTTFVAWVMSFIAYRVALLILS